MVLLGLRRGPFLFFLRVVRAREAAVLDHRYLLDLGRPTHSLVDVLDLPDR